MSIESESELVYALETGLHLLCEPTKASLGLQLRLILWGRALEEPMQMISLGEKLFRRKEVGCWDLSPF